MLGPVQPRNKTELSVCFKQSQREIEEIDPDDPTDEGSRYAAVFE